MNTITTRTGGARRALLAAPLLVLGTALPLAGCASSEQAQDPTVAAATASDSARELGSELEELQARVQSTVDALDSVVAATDKGSLLPWKQRTAEGELHPAYEGFVDELDGLRSQQRRTEDAADRFRASATTYVETWARDLAALTDEDLKRRSRARFEQVKERIDAARVGVDRMTQQYGSFVAQLEEIRTVLGLDLNQDGVLALEKSIERASKAASPVKFDIGRSVTALDRMAGVMSSAPVAASAPASSEKKD
jgi:DNA repair exonuclease SbcCD ATPase subunit